MSVSHRFQTRDVNVPLVADPEATLSRYKRLRHVSMCLNSELVKRLSKDVIHEGARKLGMLEGNTIVLDSEDESSVLMDYCIYNVRRDGRNAIESYLISCSTDSESDEINCLRAMQDAIYSIFMIEKVVPGLGVIVEDMRAGRLYFVVDTGFAMSGKPGAVFASRLLFHDGSAMTGGAALPIGVTPPGEENAFTRGILDILGPENDAHFDPASVICACRAKGASSKVRYIEPTRLFGGEMQLPTSQAQASVEPYEPCPCGSGKKFKFCCRKRH